MPIKLEHLLLFVLSLILTSCSTTQIQPASEITSQKPIIQSLAIKPNVTLVRVKAYPTGLTKRMKVDGVEVAQLKNKQYANIYIEPGKHTLEITYRPLSFQKGATKEVLIEPNKLYVFEVSSKLYSGPGGYGNAVVSLKEHNPDNFKINLIECCKDVSILN